MVHLCARLCSLFRWPTKDASKNKDIADLVKALKDLIPIAERVSQPLFVTNTTGYSQTTGEPVSAEESLQGFKQVLTFLSALKL